MEAFTYLYLQPQEDGLGEPYTCTVVGRDDRGLLVTVPRLAGGPVRLPVDAPLWAHYSRGLERVEFATRVVGYVEGNPTLMLLSTPAGEWTSDMRAAPRLPVRWPVTLAAGALRDQPAQTRDVGPGGVQVDTPVWLREGALVDLTIHVPGGLWCRARGQVVWSRWEGACVAGVAFTDMAPGDRQRWSAALMRARQRF